MEKKNVKVKIDMKTINEFSKEGKYKQKQAKKGFKKVRNFKQKQRDTEKRRIKSRPKTKIACYSILFEYLKALV